MGFVSNVRMFPLMLVPLIIYGLATLFTDDTTSLVVGPDVAAMHPFWDHTFGEFMLVSGKTWALTRGEALIAFSAFIFFVSVVRSASSEAQTAIGAMLSVITVCIYVIVFLTLSGAGTSVFFLLTVFALLDTLAEIALAMITSRARIRGAVEG